MLEELLGSSKVRGASGLSSAATLTGSSAANTITGGLDHLVGGGGQDSFIIDHAGASTAIPKLVQTARKTPTCCAASAKIAGKLLSTGAVPE